LTSCNATPQRAGPPDEFTARTDAAYHAVTHADLTILAADLPDEPARRKPSPGPVAAALVVAAV
jgi:hypothetical protein